MVIGPFYDTYNALGWGYPERIYANAMPIFLRRRGLQLEREVVFPVALEGVALGLLLNFGPKPERRRVIWTDDIHVLRDR